MHKSKKIAYQSGVYKARLKAKFEADKIGSAALAAAAMANVVPALLRPTTTRHRPPSTVRPVPVERIVSVAYALPDLDPQSPSNPSLASLCDSGSACPRTSIYI